MRTKALMFLDAHGGWIDVSYRARLQEMLVRTQERFVDAGSTDLVDQAELSTLPLGVIVRVFSKCPQGQVGNYPLQTRIIS